MTRSEMRIAIAKDVLAMLRDKANQVFISSGGAYFESFREPGERIDNVKEYLQTHSCRVCALGAMFVAEVDRNNELRFQDLSRVSGTQPGQILVRRPDIEDRLLKYFNENELSLIENVFEGDPFLYRMQDPIETSLSLNEAERSEIYLLSHFMEGHEALSTVMQHIIDNEGQLDARALLHDLQAHANLYECRQRR